MAHQARQYESEARALWLERLNILNTTHGNPNCAKQAQMVRLSAWQAEAELKASQCWSEANAAAEIAADEYIDPASIFDYLTAFD